MNLVFVAIDTLRADHLSCYGYAKPTSPNLDALAVRGVQQTTGASQANEGQLADYRPAGGSLVCSAHCGVTSTLPPSSRRAEPLRARLNMRAVSTSTSATAKLTRETMKMTSAPLQSASSSDP